MNWKQLTKAQQKAMRIAARLGGKVDTLYISGRTGSSLVNKGIFIKHGGDGKAEGTSMSYEMTLKGYEILPEEYK